jgi:hypothetical protein
LLGLALHAGIAARVGSASVAAESENKAIVRRRFDQSWGFMAGPLQGTAKDFSQAQRDKVVKGCQRENLRGIVCSSWQLSIRKFIS